MTEREPTPAEVAGGDIIARLQTMSTSDCLDALCLATAITLWSAATNDSDAREGVDLFGRNLADALACLGTTEGVSAGADAVHQRDADRKGEPQ